MLGATYTYETKKYEVGDVITTVLGRKYKVVKTLGWASFRTDIGGKRLYQYQVEFVEV